MADFQVTLADLKTRTETLQEMNTQLAQQVKALEETEATLNGMWEGAARTSFHQAFLNDIAQMGTFQKMVMIYVGALGTIYNRYVDAENRNIDLAVTRNYI